MANSQPRATSKTRATPPASKPAPVAPPPVIKPSVKAKAPSPPPPPPPAQVYPAGLPVRPPGKLGLLVDHLLRPSGASLNELAAAVDWIPHSVGGTIAGTLKQKGFVITSQKPNGVRIYKIEAPVLKPVEPARPRGRPKKAS